MKKIGTLNSKLSYIISRMGHTDQMVICDCGLPIPRSADIVDLALIQNVPRFIDALRVILAELCVERVIVAKEMEKISNPLYLEVLNLVEGIPVTKVTHAEFKRLTSAEGNITFVRTGEATPFANIILISGVTFGQ